jgi:hypothetical protein
MSFSPLSCTFLAQGNERTEAEEGKKLFGNLFHVRCRETSKGRTQFVLTQKIKFRNKREKKAFGELKWKLDTQKVA